MDKAESNSSELRYDYGVPHVGQSTSHGALLRLIGFDKRVLDIGCGPGSMAQALAGRGCQVDGIDTSEEAIELASKWCSRAICADLDIANLSELSGGQKYEVIVAADVLEHLKDPESVARQFQNLLEPSGIVIVSIPNVSHGSVRAGLLFGKFDYTDEGILDRTHIKFYTRESAREMLQRSGLTILGEFPVIQNVTSESLVAFVETELPDEVVEVITSDAEAHAFQWIFVAHPSGNKTINADIAARLYLEILAASAQGQENLERTLHARRSRRDISEDSVEILSQLNRLDGRLELQDHRLAALGEMLRGSVERISRASVLLEHGVVEARRAEIAKLGRAFSYISRLVEWWRKSV